MTAFVFTIPATITVPSVTAVPRRVTWLAAFGVIALAHAVRLDALVAGINALHPRRPVRASPVTGFRIMSSSTVLAAEGDADSVLRTSAVTAFCVPRRVLPTTPITTAPVNTSVMSRTVK